MRSISTYTAKILNHLQIKKLDLNKTDKRQKCQVNPLPILVLGNPKAGTTVIASLLGKATNQDVGIDPFYHIENSLLVRQKMEEGQISFKDLVYQNKCLFSNKIIKDPYFIFILDDVLDLFPQSEFIFISRDPRDNIRSILNRLNLPGNLDFLSEDHLNGCPSKTAWRAVLEGKLPKVDGDNYIEKLSHRWNIAVDSYQLNCKKIKLVKYEDFVQDKINFIHKLCNEINLEPTVSIRKDVNKQYQSRGNKDISWMDFFGEENIMKIEKICGDRMKLLGYELSQDI